MAAGKEQPINALVQQGAPHLPTAKQKLEHVDWHTGCVQQANDVLPRQRCVFAGLVKHTVAHEQRGYDHVAAHKPRVVPGRDVGHHAQGLTGNVFTHAPLVEHRVRGTGGLGLSHEEVQTRQQAVEFVTRLADGFAHLGSEGGRQGLELGHDSRTELGHDLHTVSQRGLRPGTLGLSGGLCFGCHTGGGVRAERLDEGARGGVMNRQLSHEECLW